VSIPAPPLLASKGFAHLQSVIDTEDARRAGKYLLNTYKREHFRLIETNSLPQYTQLAPWPEDKQTLKQIEASIPNLNPLNVATTFGSLSLESRLHETLLSFILKQSDMVAAIKPIFGENQELFCHLAPAVRIIYPGNKVAYVPNHVDIGYNNHIRLRDYSISKDAPPSPPPPFVTAWIPLQGQSSTHGGLRLYPGTFVEKTIISNHSESLWIPAINQSSNEFIPDYKIGDVVVFHPSLLHGSAPNKSIRSEENCSDSAFRISIDLRIFSLKSTTSKHYMNLQSGELYGPRDGPCASL